MNIPHISSSGIPSNIPVEVNQSSIQKETDDSVQLISSPMKSCATKTNALQKNFLKNNPSFGSSERIGTGISDGVWIEYVGKQNKTKVFVKKQHPAVGFGETAQTKRNIYSLNEVFASQLFRIIAGKDMAPKTYLYEKDGDYYVLSRKIGDNNSGVTVKNVEDADLEFISKENRVNIARTAVRSLLVSHILGDNDIKPANMLTDFNTFFRIDFSAAFTINKDLKNLLFENNELAPEKLIKSSFGFEKILPFVEENLDICKKEIIEILRAFSDLSSEQLKELLIQFEPIASKFMVQNTDSEENLKIHNENEEFTSEEQDNLVQEEYNHVQEDENNIGDFSDLNLAEESNIENATVSDQREDDFEDNSSEESLDISIANDPYFKQRMLERMREFREEFGASEPEVINQEEPVEPEINHQDVIANWKKEGVKWIQTWIEDRQEEVRQLLAQFDKSIY